jgi:hypothetical protein
MLDTPKDSGQAIPGFEEVGAWEKRTGTKPHTRRRWAAKGYIIIRQIGQKRFVDLLATARLWRGETVRQGRGRTPKKRPPDPRQVDLEELLGGRE